MEAPAAAPSGSAPPVPSLGNIERDVPYVTDSSPLQALDIYYPEEAASAPWPVMIYVHGGAWKAGDKARVDFKDDVFTQAGLDLNALHGVVSLDT